MSLSEDGAGLGAVAMPQLVSVHAVAGRGEEERAVDIGSPGEKVMAEFPAPAADVLDQHRAAPRCRLLRHSSISVNMRRTEEHNGVVAG